MSLLNDTLMEYIDQALEDAPSDEEKVDVIDNLISSLQYRLKELTPVVSMWARLTKYGTACSETALCDEHLTFNHINDYGYQIPGDDEPPVGKYVDCTGNEALQCQVCGRKTINHNAQEG